LEVLAMAKLPVSLVVEQLRLCGVSLLSLQTSKNIHNSLGWLIVSRIKRAFFSTTNLIDFK
jgi:hypothetical protein